VQVKDNRGLIKTLGRHPTPPSTTRGRSSFSRAAPRPRPRRSWPRPFRINKPGRDRRRTRAPSARGRSSSSSSSTAHLPQAMSSYTAGRLKLTIRNLPVSGGLDSGPRRLPTSICPRSRLHGHDRTRSRITCRTTKSTRPPTGPLDAGRPVEARGTRKGLGERVAASPDSPTCGKTSSATAGKGPKGRLV